MQLKAAHGTEKEVKCSKLQHSAMKKQGDNAESSFLGLQFDNNAAQTPVIAFAAIDCLKYNFRGLLANPLQERATASRPLCSITNRANHARAVYRKRKPFQRRIFNGRTAKNHLSSCPF